MIIPTAETVFLLSAMEGPVAVMLMKYCELIKITVNPTYALFTNIHARNTNKYHSVYMLFVHTNIYTD